MFDDIGVAAAEFNKMSWTGIEPGLLTYEVKVITITPHSFMKNTDAVKQI